MRPSALAFSLLLVSALAVGCATSRPQPAKPAPAAASQTPPEPSVEEVLAYGLGRAIVVDLGHFYLSPGEIEMVAKGVRDQLSNQIKIPEQERKELAMGLQAMAKKRANDRIEQEKSASNLHLAELRGREGAKTLEDTGIVILAMSKGEGDYPTEEQFLKLHSRAWLRDGTELVNSFAAGEPTLVQPKYFLPCWQEVLPQVKVGGRVQFACPSDQVYGDQGATGQVLPGAMVSFDIELLQILDSPEEAEEKFSEGAADGPPGSPPAAN
jgi:FKBP-type peptidyl-prolyl cis-trans isomerase